MSTLSLPPPDDAAEKRPIITAHEWAMMPFEARRKVEFLRPLMLRCLELPSRGKKKGYELIAASTGGLISASTLEDKFHLWKEGGEPALVDKRKLRKKGKLASGLHEDTVQHVAALMERRPHQESRVRIVTFNAAWEAFMHELMEGAMIPGLGRRGAGTWRNLFARLYPGKELPRRCPWTLEKPPPCHGKTVMRERMPDRGESLVVMQGEHAARLAVPMGRTDTSKLRPLEVIQFDDVTLNFRIWARNPYLPGEPFELVTVNALVFMDVATRFILSVRYHPAFKLPNGKTCGIERRDVQHGLAEIFWHYGFPKDYECVLRCENATAAITAAFEEALARISGGLIVVSRSDVYKGVILPDGFQSTGAASWQKGHIESFNRRLAIRLAHVPGQTGASFFELPGETAAMQSATGKVAKIGHLLTDVQIAALAEHIGMEDLQAAMELAIHDMQANPLHDMEGFKELYFWRHGVSDPEPKPVNGPDFMALVEAGGIEYANAYVQHPDRRIISKETVHAKWHRLYREKDFHRLDFSSMAFLWMDAKKGTWRAGGEVFIDLGRGREFVFGGQEHQAKPGDDITLYFDADRPELGAVVCDGKDGTWLGRMENREAITWGRPEDHARLLAEKKAVRTGLINRAGKRHGTPARLLAAHAREAERMEIVESLPQPAPSESAAVVVRAFRGGGPVKHGRAADKPKAAPLSLADLRAEREALRSQTETPATSFSWVK